MNAIARETKGMPEDKNTVSAGAGAAVVVVVGGGGAACGVCCCRFSCVVAAAAAVATVIDTGDAFATACADANYSCCACCCHRWRCCCRPFSSRVLSLLSNWSYLDILGGPKPALPETSIASAFKLAASVPCERLRLISTDRNCGLASAPNVLRSAAATSPWRHQNATRAQA